MIQSYQDLVRTVRLVFHDAPAPKPLHLIEAIAAINDRGMPIPEAARECHTTARRLRALVEAPDQLLELLGSPLSPLSERRDAAVRQSLGQLILGHLAERAFEDMYRQSVGTTELQLRDDRQARGDTDYLVYNGMGRQVFRINIKFHGSQFRRARELVGLDPDNCFALATYKIHAALVKQESEHLPYIFVIVGVPGLTAGAVGATVPEDLVHLAAIPRDVPAVSGIRLFEDRIVDRLTSEPVMFDVAGALAAYDQEIRQARWFELSARRADNLLRDLLFDRAYALRVPRFARNYGGAELDMHYSLSDDLRPLAEFLEVLREHGMPGLVSRLERGTL